MTWVLTQCTGKCVTGANAGVPEIAFAYRDPYCPLHGDAVADAETLRESLRWVRGELRKTDAENNAGWDRAQKAEATLNDMRALIDSYPPGSDFARSGAQRLFQRVIAAESNVERRNDDQS